MQYIFHLCARTTLSLVFFSYFLLLSDGCAGARWRWLLINPHTRTALYILLDARTWVSKLRPSETENDVLYYTHRRRHTHTHTRVVPTFSGAVSYTVCVCVRVSLWRKCTHLNEQAFLRGVVVVVGMRTLVGWTTLFHLIFDLIFFIYCCCFNKASDVYIIIVFFPLAVLSACAFLCGHCVCCCCTARAVE